MRDGKRILLVSIWVLSIVVTWSLASKSHIPNSSKQETPKANGSSSKTQKDSSLDKNLRGLQKSTRRINVKTETKEVDLELIVASLKEDVDFDNENLIIQNVRAMSRFIEQCSEEEIKALLKGKIPDTNENWNILRLLAFSKFGEFSPEKALKLSEELKFETGILRIEFINSWSQESPLEALAFLNSSEIKDHDSYSILFKNLSKSNHQEALNKLESVSLENKNSALEGIASNLKDSEEFIYLMSFTTDEEGQRESVLEQWAITKPVEALQWVDSNNEKSSSEDKSFVEEAWLLDQPLEAANWLLENSKDQENPFNKIVKSWDYQQSGALMDFLNDQPKSKKVENAYLELIENNHRYNLSYKKILKGIDSPGVRKEAVERIYNRLINESPEQAPEFLKSNQDLNEEEKLQLTISSSDSPDASEKEEGTMIVQ